MCIPWISSRCTDTSSIIIYDDVALKRPADRRLGDEINDAPRERDGSPDPSYIRPIIDHSYPVVPL